MRDYALLAKAFRHCEAKKPCGDCPMYGECPDIECRKNAADAIEELLANNKAIKQSNKDAAMRNKLLCDEISRMKEKVPKWISVEERLPHYLDYVLCVNKFGIQMVGYLTDYKEGGFRCESGMDSCDYITHWMPLPEPPKGVE